MEYNFFTVIEGNDIETYNLDDKAKWSIGRPSKGNVPDIKLHSITVSRKHGLLYNSDGLWMYRDGYGKNGTIYNEVKVKKTINRAGDEIEDPIILDNGDTFIFGGADVPVLDSKTVFALYTDDIKKPDWRTIDTANMDKLTFVNGTEEKVLNDSKKGDVLRIKNSIAIYMGDVTYITGDMQLK